MNARERFLETMRFGSPDRVPYWDNLRKAVLDRWLKEGLPAYAYPCIYREIPGPINVTEGSLEYKCIYRASMCTSVRRYFRLDHEERVPIDLGPVPPFEETVLEEDERYRVWIDKYGAKRRDLKTWPEPGFVTRQWLEFPVKDRADFSAMKERYNPKSPQRYPDQWENLKCHWKDRDFPLQLIVKGPFWWVRDLMGLHGMCTCFHCNADLMHEMMDFSVEFQLEALHRAVDEVRPDWVMINEDMAYKAGPMISPQMVRDFMLPGYKRITRFLREHGIDLLILDSDGNVDLLIPIWLEAGFNGIYPCEVAAEMDPVAVRNKYPHLRIIGGIDKREISKDKRAIENEVMSKVPCLVENGGYIPTIDHAVPSDIPLENYLYYRKLIRSIGKVRKT